MSTFWDDTGLTHIRPTTNKELYIAERASVQREQRSETIDLRAIEIAQKEVDELSSQLNSLNEQYRDKCVFNQEVLNAFIEDNRKRYDPYEPLQAFSLRDFLNRFQDKLADGYRYIDGPSIANIILTSEGMYNGLWCLLTKPESITEEELLEFDKKSEQTYRERLEKETDNFVPKIARLNIQLKAAQKNLNGLQKQEKELSDEINRIKAQLDKDSANAT